MDKELANKVKKEETVLIKDMKEDQLLGLLNNEYGRLLEVKNNLQAINSELLLRFKEKPNATD